MNKKRPPARRAVSIVEMLKLVGEVGFAFSFAVGFFTSPSFANMLEKIFQTADPESL